jgi:hypothetical protein
VPIGAGEERQIVDGVSYSLNFVVVDRGIYYLAWRGTPRTIIQRPPDEPRAAQHERRRVSIDFFEFATGTRTTLFDIPQAEWSYGMAVSPDQRFLLYSTIDRSDINLMLVDKFR